jgi:NTP pyrophosphatase (non-canonical NTP hydrolase)
MNRTENLLTTLAEECGEVVQVASKGCRFGLTEIGPGKNENNIRTLERELADVVAVAEMLGLQIRDEDKAAKREKVEKFLEYSRQVGRLTEE